MLVIGTLLCLSAKAADKRTRNFAGAVAGQHKEKLINRVPVVMIFPRNSYLR